MGITCVSPNSDSMSRDQSLLTSSQYLPWKARAIEFEEEEGGRRDELINEILRRNEKDKENRRYRSTILEVAYLGGDRDDKMWMCGCVDVWVRRGKPLCISGENGLGHIAVGCLRGSRWGWGNLGWPFIGSRCIGNRSRICEGLCLLWAARQ